ncbi:MAG: hypothetical protein SNJ57_12500 [Cyanobacteriota bacterium]
MLKIAWLNEDRKDNPSVYLVPLNRPESRKRAFFSGWTRFLNSGAYAKDVLHWFTVGAYYAEVFGDLPEHKKQGFYLAAVTEFVKSQVCAYWTDSQRQEAISNAKQELAVIDAVWLNEQRENTPEVYFTQAPYLSFVKGWGKYLQNQQYKKDGVTWETIGAYYASLLLQDIPHEQKYPLYYAALAEFTKSQRCVAWTYEQKEDVLMRVLHLNLPVQVSSTVSDGTLDDGNIANALQQEYERALKAIDATERDTIIKQ